MRAVFALAVLVLAASCGGGTSTPTTATAVPSTDLTPGAYTLTLSQGSVSVCQNGICTSITACTGNALTDVALPVTLSRDGDRVTVTPVAPGDSLRMVLQESASSLSGTVSGAASTGIRRNRGRLRITRRCDQLDPRRWGGRAAPRRSRYRGRIMCRHDEGLGALDALRPSPDPASQPATGDRLAAYRGSLAAGSRAPC